MKKNNDILNGTLTQFLFHRPLDEKEVITDDELIEVVAYGLSVGPEMGQPVLVLKALDRDLTLPIPLNHLEAGITLAQSNKTIAPVSPHKATAALLKAMGMQIQKCVFVEIKNSHQYVKLFVSGHPELHSLKVRAEEVLSLCLYLEVPLYTTKEFIARSRVMIVEIDEQRRELMGRPEVLNKNHLYIN